MEWVEAGSLQANPANWRKHPAHQVAALRESIADVGWAGALLFNERTNRLIDGHARRDNAEPTELVPVLVGNWDAKQERRILATLDPITALAEPDPEALGKLLDGLTFDGEALAKLGQDLAREIVLPAIASVPGDRVGAEVLRRHCGTVAGPDHQESQTGEAVKPPRKRTKQERLIALTDAYQAMFCKKEWTTREVADWATSHGLFPVPGIRDAIELHTRWNERFSQVTGKLDW